MSYPRAAAPLMAHERRKHPRAQVTMPVRLRWPGPLRHTTEITETRDVSRGGLLAHSVDGSHPDRALWLTFPFENSMSFPEPEILAHVLRVEHRPCESLIAIQFDSVALNNAKPAVERRLSPRVVIGVPVSVREPFCPWPEETMTLDLSTDGLAFVTPRIYTVGDTLKVAILPGVTPSGWSSPGEISARVIRVTPVTCLPSQTSRAHSDSVSSNGGPLPAGESTILDSPVSPDMSISRDNRSYIVNSRTSLGSNDQLVGLRRLP